MRKRIRLCGAARYERSEARKDIRADNYERAPKMEAGEVKLKVSKLCCQTFETAIIERYRRRESSVGEAMIEMYLAGVPVRRVEDITEALRGTRVPQELYPTSTARSMHRSMPSGTGRSRVATLISTGSW